MNSHVLVGLETDNLLGFLALLGLLRALESERPAWFPRAYFGGMPLRAILVTAADTEQQEIAEAAAAGCARLAGAYSFQPFSDLTFSGADARALQRRLETDEIGGPLISALCSDIAVRDDARIEPTPFCAIFGQGHQHFLDRLHNVAVGTLSRTLKAMKKPPDLNHPDNILRCLFARWERADATESFRWDFAEDRRYALRAVDPSGDAATTEHGANRLAVIGLLSFQSAPTTTGTGARLSTRAVTRPKRGRPYVTWPIWTLPATLSAVHAMLDEPQLVEAQPDFTDLKRLSIEQARRVRRITVDKFISFTRAEALV